MDAAVGLSASMNPVFHQGNAPTKQRKVFSMRFGKHRFAYTSDPGEGNLFNTALFDTRLRAIVRESDDGRILEEHDFGSGVVTNAGVLVLAYDSQLGKSGANKSGFNLFSNLQFHQWGTSGAEAKTTDIKLGAPATNKNTKSANKAVKDTTHTVTASGTGEPKFVSTSRIEAESELKIEEWGIFTFEELGETTGSPLTEVSPTTGKVTGAPLVASSETAQGERLKILNATEPEDIWGLITSNTTSVVTVPAWYKSSSGALKEPSGTSVFKLRPVMFDHRTFGVITVVSGNVIEFPWELTVKSGG